MIGAICLVHVGDLHLDEGCTLGPDKHGGPL